MNAAIAWMARNHVAANLLMLTFLIGGIIIGSTVKQEVFPEVSLDRISVSVAYPGAGPEEIERGILLPLEDSITGIDGISRVDASASEGYGSVTVEIAGHADINLVLQDVKSAVDRITTFPAGAERPIISKILNKREVVAVVIYGDATLRSLRQQAELVRDELLRLPDITQVDISGAPPYEIAIEIDEHTLRRYHLTLERVAARVRAASVDIPGGSVKAASGEILLRTMERRYFGPAYANIAIINYPDGRQLRLGDIATIKDTFAESDESASFDGQPAVMVRVFRVGEQKPTSISAAVERYIAQKNVTLPPSLHLAKWNDSAELLASRMHLLSKNAWLGLILVFITLGLFLEIRLALWVMLGIPVSFLGSLLIAPLAGVSINMVSLFAFIMALGIVVDDAIVVGENIYEQRQVQSDYSAAAITGAQQIALPVVFSILTTVCAFSPLLAIGGIMGKFVHVIPVVVISVLTVSLLESLLVLPAHLAAGRPQTGAPHALERLRHRFGAALQRFTTGTYRRALERALSLRYLIMACATAILLFSLALVGSGKLKFVFMPEVDADVITVTLELPEGTASAVTGQALQRIAAAGRATIAQIEQEQGQQVMRHIYTLTGATLAKGGPIGGSSTSASNIGTIAMLLRPSEQRSITAPQISARWRRRAGEIAGVRRLTFKSSLVHMGANIDVQLAGNDYAVLEQAAAQVKQALRRYPGVENIEDNYTRGKRELKLHLKKQAALLGITEQQLGAQVRAAYYGAEALRIQRDRDEVKVMVRYPRRQRYSAASIAELRIATPSGGYVPLRQVAQISPGRGFSTINRSERRRVVNVQARVDSHVTTAAEVLAGLRDGVLARLCADHQGLSYNLEGEERERRESMRDMGRGFILALLGIYALLAIPFRSYSQPLLIMAAIPFGITGAIFGHLLMGYPLTILSLFGVVALCGVVVNDSLLLIDTINQRRRDGDTLADAVVFSGQRRLRPILLTSLTTFFGLWPMILETSVQAKFLIPMAISLAFGIMFATGITLICIPALYMILEDARAWLGCAATGTAGGNHD